MIHVDNVLDFYEFLKCLGACTMSDKGEVWFFLFPSRGCHVIFSKEGPLVQPIYSDKMLGEQVKNGWPAYVKALGEKNEPTVSE